MSENDYCTKTMRARFTDIRLLPDNKEYGDEAQAEYALLNGVPPAASVVPIPEATVMMRIRFPAGVDFVFMAATMERLEQVLRLEVREMEAPR